MNQRKMVAGLRHEHMGLKDAEFFAHIDANGGWPLGYRFVGFVHSDGREAGFCNSPNNDGWWTVIASADDYYLWKLSPEALQRIADAAWKSIYLPRVELSRMRIKNSRGWEAACAAGVGAVQAPSADLHAAIMNLPSKWTPDDGDEQAYKRGHRDARHAAAELALGVAPTDPVPSLESSVKLPLHQAVQWNGAVQCAEREPHKPVVLDGRTVLAVHAKLAAGVPECVNHQQENGK